MRDMNKILDEHPLMLGDHPKTISLLSNGRTAIMCINV